MRETSPGSAGTTTYVRGVALVLLGTFASSWMGLGVRMVDDATAWQILVYRSFGATLVLVLIVLVSNPQQLLGVFRHACRAALIGSFGIAVAFSGIIVAFELTTVANALFVHATSPFLAAILGRVVLGERVRPATWIAIGVALAGVGITVADNIAAGHLWGNVAAGLAALGLAVFLVALRSKPGIDMLPVATFGGFLGFVVALFVCFFVTGVGVGVSTHDMSVALALGVFQLGLALFCFTIGAKYVPAAEVALIILLESVLGPIWVWLAFGETAGVLTLIGGALVLGAVAGDTLTGEWDRRRHLNRKP